MPVTRLALTCLGLLICGSIALAVQPPSIVCPQAENSVTSLGKRFDLSESFDPGKRTHVIRHETPGPATSYMRVRMRVEAPAGRTWQIVMRDAAGHAIDLMSEADFAAAAERWTSRVPGSAVLFERYIDGAPDDLRIQFLEYIAMAADAQRPYYSYQDPKNPKMFALYGTGPVPDLDDQRLGDSVAFVMAAWDAVVWTCSGVVVAPTLLMTNWHCGGIAPLRPDQYWKDSTGICKSLLIDLSWDDDGRSREFICARVLDSDEPLDIAILEIQPIEGVGALRPAVLTREPPKADLVKLIHHPEGHQKRISLDCAVAGVSVPGWRRTPGIDFTHRCDSEGGSSGSPLFQDGAVVGLHHHGFKRNPQTCRAEDSLNKAVRMDAILNWLDSTPARRALLQKMTVR